VQLCTVRPIQSTSPHPTSPRSILTLSTHLRFGLPSGIFPSGLPTNSPYAFLFSPIRASCHVHPILFHFIFLIILGEDYKLRSSSSCSLFHPPVTAFLLVRDILHSTLFSNILSLCSSLSVRDQISHPYTTTDKMIVFYVFKDSLSCVRERTIPTKRPPLVSEVSANLCG
jgi:hypothetical protein